MNRNLEIVWRDWLEAIRRKDLDALARALDPDVVHEGVVPSLTCHNREEVVAQARATMDRERREIHRLELTAGPDTVVLNVAGPEFSEVGGIPLDGEIFVVFTLRGDQIVRIHDYRSREDAFRAAGLAA
jgi:hypothetical protein